MLCHGAIREPVCFVCVVYCTIHTSTLNPFMTECIMLTPSNVHSSKSIIPWEGQTRQWIHKSGFSFKKTDCSNQLRRSLFNFNYKYFHIHVKTVDLGWHYLFLNKATFHRWHHIYCTCSFTANAKHFTLPWGFKKYGSHLENSKVMI